MMSDALDKVTQLIKWCPIHWTPSSVAQALKEILHLFHQWGNIIPSRSVSAKKWGETRILCSNPAPQKRRCQENGRYLLELISQIRSHLPCFSLGIWIFLGSISYCFENFTRCRERTGGICINKFLMYIMSETKW